MDSSQFLWWLKGFLHDKKQLGQEDIALIKAEAEKVIDWCGWTKITQPVVIPHLPYMPNVPYTPYYIGDPITNPGWTCDSTWNTDTDFVWSTNAC